MLAAAKIAPMNDDQATREQRGKLLAAHGALVWAYVSALSELLGLPLEGELG